MKIIFNNFYQPFLASGFGKRLHQYSEFIRFIGGMPLFDDTAVTTETLGAGVVGIAAIW